MQFHAHAHADPAIEVSRYVSSVELSCISSDGFPGTLLYCGCPLFHNAQASVFSISSHVDDSMILYVLFCSGRGRSLNALSLKPYQYNAIAKM